MNKMMLALAAVLMASAAAAAQQVSYPQDYRDWRHIKSMVIQPGHPLYELVGGIHHIYANPKALQGYKAGVFPDGAVIVFELFEAKDADKAIAEGSRKAVLVMQKDRDRFKDTGGWGFEAFPAGTHKGTLDAKAAKECFACHTPQKDHDFVFSRPRD